MVETKKTVFCDFCGKEVTQAYDKSTPYVTFCGRIRSLDIDLCDKCFDELWEQVRKKKWSKEE